MADNKTAPVPSAPRPNEISVKVIKFRNDLVIEIPGTNASSNIKSNTDAKGRQTRHVVTYVPQMRHHRIEYYKPSEEEGVVTSTHWIHETMVASWEAA